MNIDEMVKNDIHLKLYDLLVYCKSWETQSGVAKEMKLHILDTMRTLGVVYGEEKTISK